MVCGFRCLYDQEVEFVRLSASTLVAAFFSAAILAACGGVNNGLTSSTPLSVASQRWESSFVRRPPTAARYKVLHSFGGGTDGQSPAANLTVFKGSLYGTTYGRGGLGYGTLFRMSTSGVERVLHSFNHTDGAGPVAALTTLSGTLYGSTADGGSGNPKCGSVGCGIVFSAGSAGRVRVLYRFRSFRNGDHPQAGLTVFDDTLYGTTYYGGGGCGGTGCGTAFSLTTAGVHHVIHYFGRGFGHKHAPYNPVGTLTLLNDTFYGATLSGGASDLGAIFVLSPAGKQHVLYSFSRGSGGSSPMAGVTALNGTLYGTTLEGGTGTGCAGTGGCGTVFGVTTNGEEHLVYSFNYSDGDGSFPEASLTVLNGTLYGTTASGGVGCRSGGGCGTVFSLTTDGQETVLHSFMGGTDGAGPVAGLTALHGTLYGTTSAGGKDNEGTVFALTP
jgi:uncharacterized repeat protein (TIGR03803 family)